MLVFNDKSQMILFAVKTNHYIRFCWIDTLGKEFPLASSHGIEWNSRFRVMETLRVMETIRKRDGNERNYSNSEPGFTLALDRSGDIDFVLSVCSSV